MTDAFDDCYQESVFEEIRSHIRAVHHEKLPQHFHPEHPRSVMSKHVKLKLPYGLMILCNVVQSENKLSIYATDILRHKRWERIPFGDLTGEAACCPEDTWDYKTGYRIALNRLVARMCMRIMKSVAPPEDGSVLCDCL